MNDTIYLLETDKLVTKIYNSWYEADKQARSLAESPNINSVRLCTYHLNGGGHYHWDKLDAVYYKHCKGGEQL